MNENKYSFENNLIYKRLNRNKKLGMNSMILPDINISLSSSNINNNSRPNILDSKNFKSQLDLNPKLLKIFNNSKIKRYNDNYKHIYNKNKQFGKLANNIAILKMKNYYYYNKNDSFKNKDNEDEIKNEENNEDNIEKYFTNTNKKYYIKQKSFIEKIMKKQKYLFNNNNHSNDNNLTENNVKRNLSDNNYKIHLEIKNPEYKNPN